LGVAKIAVDKVIPAMQAGTWCSVDAIASREGEKARSAAARLGIPRSYGSYRELLEDREIEAIYNPLPNHLHVPLTIEAARAGKHVLCEKPLALTADEARTLLAISRECGVLIEEAFMVRTHPQWVKVKSLIRNGAIGSLRAIQGAFSYYNVDPGNVRNVPEYGGGGLLDIGCYPINTSRFVTDREPERVFGVLEYDPVFGVDRLASAILDFGDIQSSFVASTQMVPYQRMNFFGTEGRLEIEIPFNAPPDRPCRIFMTRGDLFARDLETLELPICNQYTIQGDLFSEALRSGQACPISLEDSVRNMAVLDAVVRSSKSGMWEKPE